MPDIKRDLFEFEQQELAVAQWSDVTTILSAIDDIEGDFKVFLGSWSQCYATSARRHARFIDTEKRIALFDKVDDAIDFLLAANSAVESLVWGASQHVRLRPAQGFVSYGTSAQRAEQLEALDGLSVTGSMDYQIILTPRAYKWIWGLRNEIPVATATTRNGQQIEIGFVESQRTSDPLVFDRDDSRWVEGSRKPSRLISTTHLKVSVFSYPAEIGENDLGELYESASDILFLNSDGPPDALLESEWVKENYQIAGLHPRFLYHSKRRLNLILSRFQLARFTTHTAGLILHTDCYVGGEVIYLAASNNLSRACGNKLDSTHARKRLLVTHQDGSINFELPLEEWSYQESPPLDYSESQHEQRTDTGLTRSRSSATLQSLSALSSVEAHWQRQALAKVWWEDLHSTAVFRNYDDSEPIGFFEATASLYEKCAKSSGAVFVRSNRAYFRLVDEAIEFSRTATFAFDTLLARDFPLVQLMGPKFSIAFGSEQERHIESTAAPDALRGMSGSNANLVLAPSALMRMTPEFSNDVAVETISLDDDSKIIVGLLACPRPKDTKTFEGKSSSWISCRDVDVANYRAKSLTISCISCARELNNEQAEILQGSNSDIIFFTHQFPDDIDECEWVQSGYYIAGGPTPGQYHPSSEMRIVSRIPLRNVSTGADGLALFAEGILNRECIGLAVASDRYSRNKNPVKTRQKLVQLLSSFPTAIIAIDWFGLEQSGQEEGWLGDGYTVSLPNITVPKNVSPGAEPIFAERLLIRQRDNSWDTSKVVALGFGKTEPEDASELISDCRGISVALSPPGNYDLIRTHVAKIRRWFS